MEYHFIRDKIVHRSEAQISVFDLAVARGYGVFDFFKVLEGVPVFAEDHIQRFIHSASKLRMEVPMKADKLLNLVQELIDKNNIENGVFKVLLTGGESSNGFNPDGSPTLLILPGELSFKVYHSFDDIKNLKLKTLDYVRETPGIKSINYLVAMMNWHQLERDNYDDFIYVKNGFVSETSRANIFIVTREGKLVTPDTNILEGITRKHIIAIGKKLLPVEERSVTMEETLKAAEIFLTSTTKQAMPVVDIDGHLIQDGKPGPVTRTIFQSFHSLEMEYIKNHKGLLV